MGWGNKVPEVDPNLTHCNVGAFHSHFSPKPCHTKLPTPLCLLLRCLARIRKSPCTSASRTWVAQTCGWAPSSMRMAIGGWDWHSSKGLDSWWRTLPINWRLTGWEFWCHEAEWPHVFCHNVPVPSTMPLHEPKVLTSSWHSIYDAC